MKILIIGSKGFIGQHLLEYLLKMKYDVYGCDVITDYGVENYFLIDPVNSDFNRIFDENTFDICVNCSGAAEVSASVKEPLRDFILNTLNVFKLLDAIRLHQSTCKFFNLSSAAVYGNPLYLPIDENHPLNPVSPYGFHKLAAENICKEFSDLFEIKTCNIRIFSAYGPGLKKQLFWDLYIKSKKKKLIPLYGTGNESRDFIYLDDLMQAIELIIQKFNFKDRAINVGNGNEIFIKDVVCEFYNNFNVQINYCFSGESKIGDPVNWKADISKLISMGYNQNVSFEEGVKKYCQWIEELN